MSIYKSDRCIFLGNYYSNDMIEKFTKYTSLSIGNDNYEKNFLIILKELFNEVISFSTPSLPRYSHKFPFFFIKGSNEKANGCETEFIPFINGRIFNTRKKNLKNKLYKIIEKNLITFIFISTYHYSWIIKPLKHRFPNLKIIMLLPDLPFVFVNNKSFFNKIYMKNTSKVFKKVINLVDLLMPITPKEIEQLPDYSNETFVYETFFDAKVFARLEQNKNKKILYVGTLDAEYGIADLVNSFKNANLKDFELLVCGKGNYEREIKQESNNFSNIKYLGFLSKDEIYKLETQSYLIVCPDSTTREYSFHSRYLEFLSSGTPILTYKPAGAKDEYLQFFNFVESYGDLTKALKTIVGEQSYSDALKKAKLGREFMLRKKNSTIFSQLLFEKLQKIS